MTQFTKKLIFVFVFILFPIGLAFDVNLTKPLTDGFHEGEYIGNLHAIRSYYSGISVFPMLIHGAMDYLPSILASVIASDSHLLIWTRFLNILAVALCWVLYIDLSRIMLREQSEKIVWGLLFYVLFLWMAIATGDDPLKKQQAFLGTRDLFLLLSLWVGARALYCRSVSSAYFHMIASGAFAAMSFYWSYDRGILSAIWVIIYAVTLLFQRNGASAFAIALGYIATLVIVSQSTIFGSLLDNYHNIVYWLKNTQDVWFLAFKYKLPALPGALAMLIFSLVVIFHAIIKSTHQGKQRLLPIALGLIFIQLVFLTKMYSLPGFPTSYYFVWPSFFLLILMPPKSDMVRGVNEHLAQLFSYVNRTYAVLSRSDKRIIWGVELLLIIIFSNSIVSDLNKARQLVHPLPDQVLIDGKHYGIDAANRYNFDCVFLWSNEGVFSLLLKKTYCTKYTYAVYISKNDEASVLNELRNNPPGLIVYDSPFWSMNIYGRHMRDRLPAINRFIQENYIFHDSGNGYVFATPK
ncbi:hypothetical protein [Undibacterium oligocarboniphilum]|uniref:Glycosyltransferase RgtA/B/C/D-like domain-containing protein n=1 Tax=Undibacterium oligocarboniphilum TaxID=666702 RepID=A0A850QFW3_9BURK|nr:hypothetical protein [Undibacterium oligocarboniphilum]MBC3869478.1 hypothetical protein [Undibacterium oligocarboniphilum]NVO77857.1 hypothetical protein [Undibacterium oligocarboniphilum]